MTVADAALKALLLGADQNIERKVDCGPCRACCHNIVVLVDEDPAEYEVDPANPLGNLPVLKRRPNGACIYLGPEGCTIYERRPSICRSFDCGLWFLTTDRPYRRHMKRGGDDHDRQMLTEGRKRALARRDAGEFPA